jgi:hypothetical protein
LVELSTVVIRRAASGELPLQGLVPIGMHAILAHQLGPWIGRIQVMQLAKLDVDMICISISKKKIERKHK